MKDKKRIVVLTGAGAVIDWDGPTTKKITDKIINDNEFCTINHKPIGKLIHEHLTAFYFKEPHLVNFETILNYVETIYQFFESKYSVGVKKFRNANPVFFDFKSSLADEILDFWRIYQRHKINGTEINQFESLHRKTYMFNDYNIFWQSVYKHFLFLIREEIEVYQRNAVDFKHGILNQQFNTFINSFDNSVIRFYSTNYDRLPAIINKNLFEGFTPDTNGVLNFDANRVMRDDDCNCYYNLHGNFNYERGFDNLVLNTEKTNSDVGFGDADGENRSLLVTNIITGLNKSSRILNTPFAQFYNKFFSDCYSADLIITIGYSYSDIHLNNPLINSKTRIIIVGYDDYGNINYPIQFAKDIFREYNPGFGDETGWNTHKTLYRKGFKEFLANSEWQNMNTN